MRRVQGRGARQTRACAVLLALLLASLSFLVGAPSIAAAATGTTVVDTLTGPQTVTQTGVGSSGALLSPATGALGGARRLAVVVTAAPDGGAVTAQVAPTTGTGAGAALLVVSPATGVATRTTLVYDAGGGGTPGEGTAGAVNPSGLGAVDLTDGGSHDVLAAAATASLPGVVAVWTLWTDATHCSSTSEPVPVGTPATGPAAIAARFADLVTATGCAGPVVPSKVGALSLQLDASAAPGATISLGQVRSATVDHGDLPAAYGLTTIAENGAAAVVDPTLGLGSTVTGEPDGVPSATATSDAGDDGVALTPGLTWQPGSVPAGAGGGFDVTVVGTGCLDLWGDLAADSTFTDAGDHLVTSQPVTDGVTHVRFPLPVGFAVPTDVTVRTRLSPRDADGSCTTPEQTTGLVNGGEVEDSVFTVTPAPGAPTFTGPATPGNGTMPRWAFLTDTGDTATCQLRGPGGPGAAAPCTSPYVATLSGGDGAYSLTVAATDALGRTTSATSSPYQLDTTAPAAPVFTVRPTNPTSSRTPHWAYTLEPGATARCRLLLGATVAEPSTTCTGGVTYDLTGKADGQYTLEVVAVDAAGNTGAPATASLDLDTTAPAAPTVVAAPAGPTASRSFSWSFRTAADATARCSVTGPGGIGVRARSACASPVTIDLTGLPDGPYTLSLVAVDAAGNVSPATSSSAVLDTTAPAVTIASGPRNPGNNPTLTWQLTVNEPTTSVQCRLDRTPGNGQPATQVAGWAACTATTRTQAYTASYPGNVDGTYTLSARAVDVAGNRSAVQTATTTLTTTVPTAPTITGAPTTSTTPTANSTLTWSFVSDPQLVAFCTLGGPPSGLVAGPAPCSSRATYEVAGRPDGVYVFSVYTSDQAGNVSVAATSLITLDRSVPGLVITSSPLSPGNTRQPTWGFRADAGSSTECSVVPAGQAASYTACSGTFTGALDGVPDGTITFLVRATNAAGTVSAPVTSSYQLLTAPPVAPTLLSRPATPSNSTAPRWTFSTPAGTSAQCRLDAAAWQPCAGSWSASLVGSGDGDVTFDVRTIDAATNASVATTSLYTLDTRTNAPSVTPLAQDPTNSPAVVWTYRVDGDATASCRLLPPGVVDDGTTTGLPAFVPCPSPHSVQLGSTQGEWVLELVAMDASGNTSPVTRTAVTLDTVAPLPPVVVASPSSPSANRTPVWTFTGPSDALTSCQLVSADGTVIAGWALCSGSVSADLTALPDGSYAEQFRAQDQAGNVSQVVATQPYVLQRNAPPLPVIATDPGAGGPSTALAWTFTTAPGTTTECQLSTSDTVGPWTPCAGTAGYDVSSFADGPLVFSVRATNATTGVTGGAAAWPYQLDRSPPQEPIVSHGPGAGGLATSPTWFFYNPVPADAAATSCQLTLVGGPAGAWQPCSQRFTGNLAGQPQGDYAFAVRSADIWGNQSSADTEAFHYGTLVLTEPVAVTQAPVDPAPPVPPTRPVERASAAPSKAAPRPAASTAVVAPRPGVVAPPPALPTSRPVAPAGPVGPTAAAGVRAPQAPDRPPVITADASPKAIAAAPSTPDSSPPQHTAPVPEDQSIPGRIGRAVDVALQAGRDHVALPLGLLALVIGFLAIQDRLDRGDPKLAQAPAAGMSDWAEFA